jgi:hypothetical protein
MGGQTNTGLAVLRFQDSPAKSVKVLTHIATTESNSLCVRMKSWRRFWNWNRRFVSPQSAWRLVADMFAWTGMRAAPLQDALERLTAAIRDVESELTAMKAEHDPLASHIFVSRRHYRNVNDTKSGQRREMIGFR